MLWTKGGFDVSKVQCYVDDHEIMCYWQRRFWQLFKLCKLETREELCQVISGEDEE